MSVSRFSVEMQDFMLGVEQAQLARGEKFINYRVSHSDGRQYGDLDPRFLTDSNDINYSMDALSEISRYKEIHGKSALPRSVCVTTPEIRRAKLQKDLSSKKGVSEKSKSNITLQHMSKVQDINQTINSKKISQSSFEIELLEKIKLSHLVPNGEVVLVNSQSNLDILCDAIKEAYFNPETSNFTDWNSKMTSWSLDAEWKPSSQGGEENPISTLQLGSKNQVFIVDMQTLCRSNIDPNSSMNVIETTLSKALTKIFANDEISIGEH